MMNRCCRRTMLLNRFKDSASGWRRESDDVMLKIFAGGLVIIQNEKSALMQESMESHCVTNGKIYFCVNLKLKMSPIAGHEQQSLGDKRKIIYRITIKDLYAHTNNNKIQDAKLTQLSIISFTLKRSFP
ncbi:hypothetical protein NPIL_58211 [Nephila pilipes]|uniref:Uncharacterized protein n=1 Tax=Nephila pilipes TaxID=299642 RepID=A0A8X6NLQ9_NEPPI|nr:hypothetical protein NPIL_58211 [Nephila pilipes]